MARDYTKYKVEGIEGIFGKGKLVLAVVKDYCSKNKCTYDELKSIFPDEVQNGNTGVFGDLESAQKIAKKRPRHYVNDPIEIDGSTIAVSNQWGDNLPLFLKKASELGYEISEAGENKVEQIYDSLLEAIEDYDDQLEDLYNYKNDKSQLEILKQMYQLIISDDYEITEEFWDDDGDMYNAFRLDEGFVDILMSPEAWKALGLKNDTVLVQKISNLIYNMPMTDRQSQFRERENELKEAGLL